MTELCVIFHVPFLYDVGTSIFASDVWIDGYVHT